MFAMSREQQQQKCRSHFDKGFFLSILVGSGHALCFAIWRPNQRICMCVCIIIFLGHTWQYARYEYDKNNFSSHTHK